MIPSDYFCADCSARGVKLWRKAHLEDLRCAACIEKLDGEVVDLSRSMKTYHRLPAVPTLTGSYWGVGSIPAEGWAWWNALPVRLDGEWKVPGGVMRWLTFAEWRAAGLPDVAYVRDGSRLVFVQAVA